MINIRRDIHIAKHIGKMAT